MNSSLMARGIAGGVVLLLLIVLTTCSMETVNTGNRGIKTNYGKIVDEPLTEGMHFIIPVIQRITEISVRTNKWEAETQAYTRDVQQATVGFTLNYNLDPTKAAVVFRDVGPRWSETLVAQVIYEQIKQVFGQYIAVDIVAQRDEAARAIERGITTTLAARNVNVTGFQLTNIDYTTEFERAVEAKVIAQQAAIQEQNRSVQIAEQAKQQILTAEGNAKSTVLNAQAEAESIKIRATALEQNAKLVEWEAVQKWNGVMPTMMMGDSVPFINIGAR